MDISRKHAQILTYVLQSYPSLVDSACWLAVRPASYFVNHFQTELQIHRLVVANITLGPIWNPVPKGVQEAQKSADSEETLKQPQSWLKVDGTTPLGKCRG